MSEKIFEFATEKGIKIQRWFEEIHPMDHQGSAHYQIQSNANGHEMTIISQWFNCGEIIEVAECSCDFASIEAPGNGCHQQDHNVAREHEFDELHAEMYAAIGEMEEAELAEMRAKPNPPRRRPRKSWEKGIFMGRPVNPIPPE